MSKSKILKHTANYHDELIESLKNPKEANLYLRIAMEEYQEDRDTESLLVALRNIAEAKGGISRLAKKNAVKSTKSISGIIKKRKPYT